MSRYYSRNLYQLGGFQGNLHMRNLNDYGMENTCRMVFEALSKPQATELKYSEHDELEQFGVELILGITSNGTSYVHLDDVQMRLVSDHTRGGLRPVGQFKNPYSFESLSPIRFATVENLIIKIDTYKQKTKKKNKKQDPFDNSKANESYSTSISRSWRPEFELSRVLSKVLSRNILEEKFFISQDASPRLVKATVIAIAVNVHTNGHLLDIAWIEVPLKAAFEDVTGQESSRCHITIQERQALKLPGFRRVTSQNIDAVTKKHAEMLTDLKAFWESRTSSDVLLLVHDRVTVEAAFENAGIDTRTLKDGLHGLLGPSSSRPQAPGYDNRGRHGVHDYDNKSRRRSRSRSPRRGQAVSEPQGPIKKRSASPSTPRSVFVIEVDKLYNTIDTHFRKTKLPLHQVAKALDVSVNPETICAGDDCYTIINSWVSMASGPPIDEQRLLRGFSAVKTEDGVGVKVESTPQPQPEAEAKAFVPSTESDDEYDPNDAPVVNEMPRKSMKENVPHIGIRRDVVEDDDNRFIW
ncbi:hypothetical protein SCHPADRAFT_909305 [Schizopora paradoxa]|uniref:Uncharacterized protein n=1 Tax=Schizopora paradoxa TaxID=27342 RepID=A0A0H2RS39_9AGAM|nr:hypothetical protein SCHPADRAFT_909305 [Schizopora paradoxa]